MMYPELLNIIFKHIEYDEMSKIISVRWKLQGVLNLPWHPELKPYTGTTHYHVDDEGMIAKHIEDWDISMLDAFLCTLLPVFSNIFSSSNALMGILP